MKRFKKLLVLFFFVIGLIVVLFYGCGGGEGSSDKDSSSGRVELYVTDDMSDYKQVMTTINDVQLMHTGTGTNCDVLSAPVSLDITDLSSILQLVDVSQCNPNNYNRIHIEFDKSVELMNKDGLMSTCSYTQYKTDNNQPNVLHCNETTCSMDINGAVNVFANQTEKLALDFDLKDFDISYTPTGCAVTMKVSPLNSSAMMQKRNMGYRECITGNISNLNINDKSFTMVKGKKTFSINYSQVHQQNIDYLLQFAIENDLKVKVEISQMDANTCLASSIYILIEGTVSNLNTHENSFKLTFKNNNMININYNEAINKNCIEGSLFDGAYVEIKLFGYDDANNYYLANCIQLRS